MANSILNQGLAGMPGSVPQMPMQPASQMPVPTPMGGGMPLGSAPMANSPLAMMGQIQNFARTIRGNPQQMVMQMIQSGQRTNADLQQAMQIARQITGTGMYR